MALRDLNIQEKLAVSSLWLDPNHDRPLLESNPLLKAGLDALEPVHQRLLLIQREFGTIELRIRELTEQMTEWDRVHDSRGRGINYVLTGGIEFALNEAEASPYEDALRALYPLGLVILRSTYNQQAGTAMQVRENLTPERRAFLASIIVTGGRTLLDETQTWLDAAVKIGELFDQRAKLIGDEDDAVTQGDLYSARLEWIGAVNDLLKLLDIARVDDITRRRLLANLHKTEQQAIERRRRASSSTSQEEILLQDQNTETPDPV